MAPLQMEWVFASCDTEHSASAVPVKCNQIARKAQSSPVVYRCKSMHTFVPYYDTEVWIGASSLEAHPSPSGLKRTREGTYSSTLSPRRALPRVR